MSQIRTALSHLLPSLRVPIVSGPMSGASGGRLAAEVSKAGGFGFIGGGYFDPESMNKNLEEAMGILGKNEEGERLEIGVGFLAWRLSQMDGGGSTSSSSASGSTKKFDSASRPKAAAYVDTVLSARPRAIWLAFGTPDELVSWADYLRRREKAINGHLERRLERWRLFVGVGSEGEAKVAVEEVGADVIVAQSYEAGGHGNPLSPSLSVLIPSILRNLPSYKPLNPHSHSSSPSNPPILLGAGGLSSGRHLASLLALGAQGAVYGTRFLLTPECTYSDARKQILKSAGEGSTIRSMAFDEARNTLDWPSGIDGRGIRNTTWEEFDHGKKDLKTRQKRYAQAEEEEDMDRLITWAGTGVGEMREVMPAGEVVREMEREAIDAICGVAETLYVP